ncbi:MAG: hypothetical protein ABL918_02070 [Chakrabartia sp.]
MTMMTPTPTRTQRATTSRLLSGCAIAVAWAACGYAPVVRAQSFLGTHAVTSGSADVFTGPNATTVVVNSPTVVLDWTPTDTALTGELLFQNAGTTATFVNGDPGLTDYVVLNRILPINVSFPVLTRPVRLDGIIRSLYQAPGNNGITRGSIWFYSPGGLILGQSARIDVGSLVLSTSDINTQNLFAGNVGTINFTGAPTANSAITIENGARINALLDKSSYVAMVAPRIVQGGTVAVDGSVAYVAAEAADISINQGLFDISVQTGSGDANGIVHTATGSTTGPASTPTTQPQVGDTQHIYMVAVPKNTAMTMLLGGTIGYTPAASVTQEQSAVILSAGYDIVAGVPEAVANASATANATIQAGSAINTGGDTIIRAAALSADNLITTGNTAIATTGNILVSHSESGGNFTASGARVETGLNSIITGGNISITSAGDVLLGNSSAGGFANVFADGLINFNSLTAGTDSVLSAGATIAGGTLNVGGVANLSATSGVNVTTVIAGDSLFASTNTGNLTLGTATAVGDLILQNNGTGPISTTTATAGGDIVALSGGTISFGTATANGTYINGNGQASIGNIYMLADGNVNFGSANAATMIGVSATNISATATLTAGEDILLLASGLATVDGASAGDDLDIIAPGGITLTNGTARATARDDRTLRFIPGFSVFDAAFDILASPADGSDIRLTSTGGGATGANLTAGDDILINVSGATNFSGTLQTRGVGTTGGLSNIEVTAGSATIGGGQSFTDFLVTTAGNAALGTVTTGRNLSVISGANATFTNLTSTGSTLINAGGNITGGRAFANTTLDFSGVTISTADLAASTSITLTALGSVTAGNLDTTDADIQITAATGITFENASAEGGSIILNNLNGIISTENMTAARDVTINNVGNVSVRNVSAGDDIRITTSAGDIDADSLQTSGGPDSEGDGHNAILNTNRAITVGQVRISQGDLVANAGQTVAVSDAIVSGNIDLRSGNADVVLNGATSTAITTNARNDVVFNGIVTANTALNVTADRQAIFNGTASGLTITVRSNDIAIAATGRLGTAGTTRGVSLSNLNGRQMVVGGAGVATGYSLSAAEFARVFSNDISVTFDDFNINTSSGQSPASVGSAAAPDMIIDSFILTAGAGATPGNIGGQGTLSFTAPKIRVIGNAVLSNAGASNVFSINADDALEIISGTGSLEVRDAGSGLTGTLALTSDDIIAATSAAITAVSAMTAASDITTRLNQNDGVANAGTLRAGTINATVANGIYVQNMGISDRFADRRGFTTGTGGFNIRSANAAVKIIVNGQIATATTGFATGLATIPLVTINGQLSQSATGFDPLSTVNGCLIAGITACRAQDNPKSFPSDSITGPRDNDDPFGVILPSSLFELKEFEPYGYPPLIDEPVTGAGNDDLWPTDCSASDAACQTPAG